MGSFLRCLRETEHSAMAKRLQPIFREVVREVLQEMREMDREVSTREAVVERTPSARPKSPATPGRGHVKRNLSYSAENVTARV